MSKHFVVLGNGLRDSIRSTEGRSVDGSSPEITLSDQPPVHSEYFELIRLLFHGPSVVALIGSRSVAGGRISTIAEKVAAELSALGKRVIVVCVNELLLINPIPVPYESAFIRSSVPHVWFWPAGEGFKPEAGKPRDAASVPSCWLDILRRTFDAVIFDCPEIEGSPGVTEVAALADAAVLVVEAGRASKQRILQDRCALQLRGARVVGSILVERSCVGN